MTIQRQTQDDPVTYDDEHAHRWRHCHLCGEDFCLDCDPEHRPNCVDAHRP